MQTPPLIRPKRPPDWWERNWKWAVPVIGVVVIVLIGGFVATLLGFMRSSDAYSGAIARVKDSPRVIEALGTPIEDGYFFTGSVNVSNDSGGAQFAIPISGPKGTALVSVVAVKAAGQWHFGRLLVLVGKTESSIDLSETRPNQTVK